MSAIILSGDSVASVSRAMVNAVAFDLPNNQVYKEAVDYFTGKAEAIQFGTDERNEDIVQDLATAIVRENVEHFNKYYPHLEDAESYEPVVGLVKMYPDLSSERGKLYLAASSFYIGYHLENEPSAIMESVSEEFASLTNTRKANPSMRLQDIINENKLSVMHGYREAVNIKRLNDVPNIQVYSVGTMSDITSDLPKVHSTLDENVADYIKTLNEDFVKVKALVSRSWLDEPGQHSQLLRPRDLTQVVLGVALEKLNNEYVDLSNDQKSEKLKVIVMEFGVKLDDSSLQIIKDLIPKQSSRNDPDNNIPHKVAFNESVIDFRTRKSDNEEYKNTGHDYPSSFTLKL